MSNGAHAVITARKYRHLESERNFLRAIGRCIEIRNATFIDRGRFSMFITYITYITSRYLFSRYRPISCDTSPTRYNCSILSLERKYNETLINTLLDLGKDNLQISKSERPQSLFITNKTNHFWLTLKILLSPLSDKLNRDETFYLRYILQIYRIKIPAYLFIIIILSDMHNLQISQSRLKAFNDTIQWYFQSFSLPCRLKCFRPFLG